MVLANALAPNVEANGSEVLADHAHHIGRITRVPTVQQSAQLFVLAHEAVRFVHQQGRRLGIDAAENGRCADTTRHQRTAHQLA